ncbi:uncharacterized protein [Coffea arabica]|uniref:U6 snRNA phosphodiesterase 1 n=1 Tax=Coffea arabica TaxID=13443 RepID=A0A6P6VQ89_COFAR|nr:U6 snRNA phosphodiesterase-like isoform X3 [Coffea arabica]
MVALLPIPTPTPARLFRQYHHRHRQPQITTPPRHQHLCRHPLLLSSTHPILSVHLIVYKLSNPLEFEASLMSKEITLCTSTFPLTAAIYHLPAVHIPSSPRKELVQFLRKVTDLVPGLHAVDIDVPLTSLLKDDNKFEQVVLGREFHISLGRTVPIRVHQRDSVLTMLRQKLQFRKMYWIDFAKWVVFVNDDFTRSFLSMEVIAGGLAEITKQIDAVNEVYRLHNLPEFYKDPRPHISVAWALGDVGDFMTGVVEEEMKRFSLTGSSSRKHIFNCKFGGVQCRIGNRTYEICKFQEL